MLCRASLLMLALLVAQTASAQLDTAAVSALWDSTQASVSVRRAALAPGLALAVVPDTTVPLITIGLAWPADAATGELHRRVLARPVRAPYLPTEAQDQLRRMGGEFTTTLGLGVESAVLTVPSGRLIEGLRLLRGWWLSERIDTFTVGRAKADIALELQARQQTPRQQLTQLLRQVFAPEGELRYEAVRPLTLDSLRRFHRGIGRSTGLVVVGGEVNVELTQAIVQYAYDSLGVRADGNGAMHTPLISRPTRDSLFAIENALATQPALLLGCLVPTGSEADLLSAQLLTELLNQPNTRWQRALLKPGIARAASASLEPLDSSLSLLRIALEPERLGTVPACVLAVESELGALVDLTYWRPREVAAAQQRLEAGYEFSREPTSRFCRQLPVYWAQGQLALAERYAAALRGVDGFAVSEWASRHLTELPTVGGVVAPSGSAELEALQRYLDRRNHPEREQPIAAAQPAAEPEPTPQPEAAEPELTPVNEPAARADAPVWADSLAPLTVRFGLGKARIDSVGRAQLRSLAQLLRRHPRLRLYVDGHTDRVGSAAFNLQLSAQRAQLVRTYLTTRLGIAATRLRVRSYGERRPVADDTNPDTRGLNRRVEFLPR